MVSYSKYASPSFNGSGPHTVKHMGEIAAEMLIEKVEVSWGGKTLHLLGFLGTTLIETGDQP